MRHTVRLFAACALVLTGFALASDDAPKDAEKLQGAWTATSWKRGDAEFPKGINRISSKGMLKIDAAKSTIDFIPEDGPAKGKSLLGIYKVEGDVLTLCFSAAGQARPKEFKTGDRNTVLATYERKK
jgi:hypothetical protein